MDKNSHNCSPELWGGIECTINRVKDDYKDQLKYSGHYTRDGDIDKIADLGIKTLRYPVLWEHHQPLIDKEISWSWTEKQLNHLRIRGIKPIVGLLHHGSGPEFTDLLNDNFARGLAEYAHKVSAKFPWVEYYTPVNEPLTTARFSGIYGLWYPHHTSDVSFAKMFLNQMRGVVLSMKAIRKINPKAKLIQTEDLGKTYSTPYLEFQAKFENERRWLTFDLLYGRVNQDHLMWKYFLRLGIPESSLQFFLDTPCPPDIIGFNYYITSERFIDEEIKNYPACTHGGNEIQVYADVEAIRVKHGNPHGLKILLKEAWERFGLPLAISEVQLNCTREEQLKWLLEIWNICKDLKKEGIEIKAITAWSLLGAFGWDRLLTTMRMEYEPGVFDIRSGQLRPTQLAELIQTLSSNQQYFHPVVSEKGWWQRESRFLYVESINTVTQSSSQNDKVQPILIIGKTGTLGNAFARICRQRNIVHHLLGKEEADITNYDLIENLIRKYRPWAIINTAGYVKVDEAENDIKKCFDINTLGPELLAIACKKSGIQFLTFSTDLVFDGAKQSAYYEGDPVNPLNIYGKSKAQAEQLVLKAYPNAMIVRTSAFFGPWDKYNFINHAIETLSNNEYFAAADDIFISPTYVPDLVNVSLDLLIDKEKGIWHLTNNGEISWAQLALTSAEKANLSADKIILQTSSLMGWKAIRPKYSVLKSTNGNLLPSLNNALNRYFEEINLPKPEIEIIMIN
ncbi:MAG: family 1 glycosylhydrolase [Ginsengibacter sp.]